MDGPGVAISMDELEQGQRLRQYQHATPEVPRSEYHDQVVKPKLLNRPWLDILHEFLDPTTEHFAVSPDHRLLYFDIQVIHISGDGEVNPPIKCKNATEFNEAISNADSERRGTLVIAEDLSRAMIDALGMQYNLDPEFFASHLLGTQLFHTGEWQCIRDPVRAPNILPGYLRKASYYTVEFRRPYHFPGGKKTIVELRSTKTSTPRGVHILNEDIPDAFVVEKISVYKGKTFGIILTDKLLSEDLPASYMLDPVTLLNDEANSLTNDGRRHQVSCRKELIGWIQRLKPQDAKALFNDHEPLVLRPILQIVERAGTMFLAHARFIMSRIVSGQCDDQFPDSIPFFLRVSRSLHRHIHDQQKLLGMAVRVASLKGDANMAEQIDDINYLTEDTERTLRALEEDVRFLVTTASIREGRIVGLVSKFAFLFLPLSLLATILTLMDPGYIRWAVLGSLTVPFVTVSVYLMFLWKSSDVDSLSSYLPN